MELTDFLIIVLVPIIAIILSWRTARGVSKDQIAASNESLRAELRLYQRLAKRETLIQTMAMMIDAHRDFMDNPANVVNSGPKRDGARLRYNALVASLRFDDPVKNERINAFEIDSNAKPHDFEQSLREAIALIAEEIADLATK